MMAFMVRDPTKGNGHEPGYTVYGFLCEDQRAALTVGKCLSQSCKTIAATLAAMKRPGAADGPVPPPPDTPPPPMYVGGIPPPPDGPPPPESEPGTGAASQDRPPKPGYVAPTSPITDLFRPAQPQENITAAPSPQGTPKGKPPRPSTQPPPPPADAFELLEKMEYLSVEDDSHSAIGGLLRQGDNDPWDGRSEFHRMIAGREKPNEDFVRRLSKKVLKRKSTKQVVYHSDDRTRIQVKLAQRQGTEFYQPPKLKKGDLA